MAEIETISVEVTKPKRGRPKKQPQPEATPEPEAPMETEAPMEIEQVPEQVPDEAPEPEVILEPKTPRGRAVTRDRSTKRTRAPRRKVDVVSNEVAPEAEPNSNQPQEVVLGQYLHELAKHSRALKSQKYKNLLQGHL